MMTLIAMAPPPGGQPGQAQGPGFLIGWIAIMIGIFYVMIIRPQRRREKERQDLLKAIKTGDLVLFSGGIIGTVANVKEKTFVLKIADKTKVEVLRGAVTQVLNKDELPTDIEQEVAPASSK
ncbi:MAG: preprotein translocase subunit YajC [Verrucomicrobia bacterium]|nr:preprotein translocase subunit YajC [Kiritimatiellia bacterium]MCP5487195.1 preprotein translocase subunit YajC [Verrucomicrobiota bacterium]